MIKIQVIKNKYNNLNYEFNNYKNIQNKTKYNMMKY